MPRRGEVLQVGELELRVLRVDRRRVEAIKVTAPRDPLPLDIPERVRRDARAYLTSTVTLRMLPVKRLPAAV